MPSVVLLLVAAACAAPQAPANVEVADGDTASSEAAKGEGAEAEPAGRVVGGPCEYVDVAGKCTISAIAEPAAEDFQCEGGSKKVTFQFAPDDAAAQLEYGGPDPKVGTLTAGGGQHPSPGWLEANAVTEGATFACTRSHIRRGTCSPVSWAFADLKLDDTPCR